MGKIAINIATGSLQQNDLIVGIDLGTTNSLIAVIHPDDRQPMVLKETDQSTLVPSVIHFNSDGEPTVGKEAAAHLATDPANTIFSVKRLMGRSYKDVQQDIDKLSYKILDDQTDSLVKVNVGDKYYTPVELSALILKELKQRAEHVLKTPVSKAVITVPAYFSDVQRQATRDAGKLAGLDVLRIINEPTAASLAYGLGVKPEEKKTVAVYDLGGGTFDISILNIEDGVFDVLSTNGNTALGGDDLDNAIAQYWLRKYSWQKKYDPHALRLQAEEAKRLLSSGEKYTGSFGNESLELTIDELKKVVAPFVDMTVSSCRQALKDAGLKTGDIDEVVMVGGSTRMPYLKERISEFFEKPVHDKLNPDEVVALGAAVQADILAGNNKDMLLLDITPLSLGLETSGGLMDVIVPRNTKIPAKAGRKYTTQQDGQSGMRISVFQGERDLVEHNRKLAEFNLTGIPAMPAGLPQVEVNFLIDADGILKVKAKELRSGIEQEIEVKPQNGITDADVERMLQESMTHASDDVQQRAWREAVVEAEELLRTTEKFLAKNNRHLQQQEIISTANAMQSVQMALTMNDKDLLRKKTEELNDISRPYAERVMDLAIGEALKGSDI